MAEALTIDLFGVPQGESSRDVKISGELLDARLEQVELKSPIEIHLDLFRAGDSIRCRGHFACKISVVCSRCLETGDRFIEGDFDFYCQRSEGELSEEDGQSLEDSGLIFHDGMVLNLYEEIRQTILLELPWNPVCADNCRGLCSRCGKNLNQGACGCRPGPVESRWTALEKLREEDRQ
ncbi:MAG: DUF177 domain-containing protein [Candidatus Eisenbacteria bacterium]|uniref:DUF177 domain-containing protein n=1 Tax=Eiseniibacteriota bacterium TaxID=2212470 RepID=A0A948RT88_UNCEI|nr:DUF177 domain-containing protein [Candidatus Eisenbacteria bacterium]MBU1948926.1 DUF177 domain-containing protein [Candidatus Eisenbacteria bacterium]MBU2690588.1 DUF177 domain-containing protein [Candidatus Eisenbacteria bacterium]